MTYQRLLLRLRSFELSRRFLHNRVWRIEGGEGARLRLRLPQNLDYITGTNELPVQRELAKQLQAGDAFYDIGANMGFFSLIAARIVGKTGCVCAFEPVVENAAAVRANGRLNSFDNIKLFEVAVGQNSRMDELLLTAWDGGAAISTSVVKPSTPLSMRKVRVVALDDIIQAEKLPPPTLVKIDVEGVEFEVIRGMTNTIASAKPRLLYEIDDGEEAAFLLRWRELDEYVSSLGYDIVRLGDSYPDIAWKVGHSLAIPRGHK